MSEISVSMDVRPAYSNAINISVDQAFFMSMVMQACVLIQTYMNYIVNENVCEAGFFFVKPRHMLLEEKGPTPAMFQFIGCIRKYHEHVLNDVLRAGELLQQYVNIKNERKIWLVGEKGDEPSIVYHSLVLLNNYKVRDIDAEHAKNGAGWGTDTGYQKHDVLENVRDWPTGPKGHDSRHPFEVHIAPLTMPCNRNKQNT